MTSLNVQSAGTPGQLSSIGQPGARSSSGSLGPHGGPGPAGPRGQPGRLVTTSTATDTSQPRVSKLARAVIEDYKQAGCFLILP